MKGLELSRRYYEAFGIDAIAKNFPEYKTRIATGLAGEGSECFGFDDRISQDHDFEPAFCMWVTSEDYDKIGFRLERIYDSLPKEFEGFKKQSVPTPYGKRHGVFVIDDFYNRFLGTSTAPLSLEQWLYLPSHSLAAASNGEVFCDNLGEFSKIRNVLLSGYPQDVKLKKLSAHLTMMLQTGLYNYPRLIKRGEKGAAQLCIFEFVKHTISVIYLLNNAYEPFYKWVYRGLRSLIILSELEASLVSLTELGNEDLEAEAKLSSMEEISCLIVDEMRNQGFVSSGGYDLQKLSLELQNKISDTTLRNMHILEGI